MAILILSSEIGRKPLLGNERLPRENSPVRVSVIHPGELGAAELTAWRAMQQATEALAHPFLCPEFTLAIGTFRPEARVAVLTDGPDIFGFFPFERRRASVGVPIGAGLNDCQGLVHAPGAEWDPRQLLRACKLHAWRFDRLVEGQEAFARFVSGMAPSPVIDLADGFPAYQDKLRLKSPRFCLDVARRARKLSREAGELRFAVDERATAGLRKLMAWKSEQYQRNGWLDLFARPWIVDVVDYLFSTHAPWFSGLLSVLYAGETPVAAHFGLRAGRVLAGWFPAYDTRFSRQSPGLIQHLRMAEETPVLGVHQIDLGMGEERYKQTLRSYDLHVRAGMAVQGQLAGTAYRACGGPARWARSQVSKYPPLLRAADSLVRRDGRIG
jgi:CelD/BcsL family acetyltransferase involved in cellulose biosynthesis